MFALVTLTAVLIAKWIRSKWSDAATARIRICLTGSALCLIVSGVVVVLGLSVGSVWKSSMPSPSLWRAPRRWSRR